MQHHLAIGFMRRSIWLVMALLLAGCADEGGAAGTGPVVEIDVAALNLQGVGDVVWDLEVDNGVGEVVWQRRITSSSYGDGAGSASLVATCDASASVDLNAVKVWVVGLYDASVSAADAGAFASGQASGAGAVTATALPFRNPTTVATPLKRDVLCRANGDAAVSFDVSLLRPAQQGFFDVAVSFNDIFCSAKFDCCDDATGDGCAADGSEDIALLFDADGNRAPTFVLGFACTAGTAAGVDTRLYLDALELDCTPPNSGSDFAADITLDPSAEPGSLCVAGSLAACPAVLSGGAVADTYLYQVSVFRGTEALTSGGLAAHKVYWNVALGVDKTEIGACRLRTRATADDAADADDGVVGGTISPEVTYPFVQWDIALDASCGSAALAFDAPGAPVRAAYTNATSDESFDYGFGPSMPAGGFCGLGCENGGTCVSGVCQCPVGFEGDFCETPMCPLEISGCDAWNDVGDVATISGSGTAWSVADKSGHGHPLTPSEGAPVYTSAAINGLGGISFDGVGDQALGIWRGDASDPSDYRTIVMVMRLDAVDTLDSTAASVNCSDGVNRRFYWGWQDTGKVRFATGAQWETSSYTFSGGSTFVLIADRDRVAQRKRMFKDGSTIIDRSYPVEVQTHGEGRCQFGGEHINGYDEMTLGEVISYTRILTADERAQLTAYLTSKWL